MITAKK